MQFHYYALHYAMCGDSVLHGINSPCPSTDSQTTWRKYGDGIGSWLA